MASSGLGRLSKMIEVTQESQMFTASGADNCELHKTRLRNSLSTLASLIKHGNQKLWPVFERLEDELLKLEQKEVRLARYNN